MQMSFLKDALNHLRSRKFGLHGGECQCNCQMCAGNGSNSICSSIAHTYSGVTELWESVVCPKQEGELFHNRKCLMGECKNCGVQKLLCCPLETRKGGLSITVKVFAFVDIMDKAGNTRKRKDLLNREMQTSEFLAFLKSKLRIFITHNYLARWQSQQFKECIQSFPDDVVVSVVDFAENYSFKEQNEIQSMHWHSSQVSILVHITYIKKAGDIIKTVHFFISDDTIHDTLFVQHCFMLHFGWLKEQSISIKSHWVWSDGAASQFKARRSFYFVARYASLTGVQMSWFFSASGHGKGEHDGAGAVVKRTLTHEQLKADGPKLTCAADVVAYCRANLSEGADACYASKQRKIARVFWEVKVGEVNRELKWNCQPIPKSRTLHAVRGYNPRDPTGLATRQLACFCDACMHGHWNRCINKSHVPAWDYHILEPLAESEPLPDDEEGLDVALYEGHHDVLSNALRPGDTFAVHPDSATNTEPVDFYLVKCLEDKQEAEVNYVDDWDNNIPRGAYVIKGLYYKQIDSLSFNLLTSTSPVHILSHLVRCIKIPMEHIPRRRNLYCITPEIYEAIYNSMPIEM